MTLRFCVAKLLDRRLLRVADPFQGAHQNPFIKGGKV